MFEGGSIAEDPSSARVETLAQVEHSHRRSFSSYLPGWRSAWRRCPQSAEPPPAEAEHEEARGSSRSGLASGSGLWAAAQYGILRPIFSAIIIRVGGGAGYE